MLQFGRLISSSNGVFAFTVVGDGSSNSVVVDLAKGPAPMDLKGVVPVGVIQTTSGGTKTGTMTFDPKNPMQVTLTVDPAVLQANQIADFSGFFTFAGVTPPTK